MTDISIMLAILYLDHSSTKNGVETIETTALLRTFDRNYISDSNLYADENTRKRNQDEKPEDNWKQETTFTAKSPVPLMVTLVLQYGLTVSSIFIMSYLGKAELGGVSLASIAANITGCIFYQGLSICLDTLCSQAYRFRNHHPVDFYL